MDSKGEDHEFIRQVYETTRISRTPISGIVRGYHDLPYVLVGPDKSGKRRSVKLSGQIEVSPRLIFSPGTHRELFEKIFEEAHPFMDKSLVGRSFSFKVGLYENRNIRGRHLSIETSDASDQELLTRVLDDLQMQENIKTGVIWCPHPKFYPVSLERFIFSILDKEFG